MTPDAFAASLARSATQHPPSKARRIAPLLPQIEAALAQGSSRAHIVTALRDMGIEITLSQLSNVMARLRRQRGAAAGLPPADRGRSVVPSSLAPEAVALVTAVTPGAAAISPASKFGAHDPRLLDEVMRSTPDLKALAKLAPRPKPQGSP
jgi:hypothetical protein